MKTQLNLGRSAVLCAGLVLALMAETSARANVIHVNTTADQGAPGTCSLRDAVMAAGTDAAVNGCVAGSGADTIVFDISGTITLSDVLLIGGPASVTIDGTGRSITVDGQNAFRLIVLTEPTPLNLKSLTLANGFSATGGGGGAIFSDFASNINIWNTTFTNNNGGCGGAIRFFGLSTGATLMIANSTFYANGAINNGCGIESGFGGAVFVEDSTLTVVNSTFSGNRGSNAAQIAAFRSSTTLANTILGNSVDGPTCSFFDSAPPTGSGMNLVADTSCSSDLQHFTVADPRLGPLADNGGPTPTMALLPGSPAIDAADNAICAAAPIGNLDQRGQVRPTDGNNDGVAGCDIGAYELAVLAPFTGFFAPVANVPVVNSLKAGSAVPVKFSLAGNLGLNILAAGYPQSMQIACSSGSPISAVQETSSAGGSSLSYDSATSVYTYVWKTDKSWSNSCRLFTLRLSDGTDHTALFRFQ